VILAIDGLQPDMGHEVLWVIRECQSGELLLARTLLSARHQDLAELLKQVKQVLQLPIAGVISDGNQFVKQSKPHCQKSLTLCVIFTICAKQQRKFADRR